VTLTRFSLVCCYSSFCLSILSLALLYSSVTDQISTHTKQQVVVRRFIYFSVNNLYLEDWLTEDYGFNSKQAFLDCNLLLPTVFVSLGGSQFTANMT